MSLHDDYARRTPYEVAFPDAEVARDLFGRIGREAEERGLDLTDPHQFGMVGVVGDYIREVRGPDGPTEAVQEYRALVFHCYHFARLGFRLDLLSTPAVRYLVEGAPSKEAPPAPGSAGYVQLPQHLFWTTVTADGRPQSVDGVFWTLGAGDQLFVLVVLGLAGDGLVVIPLPKAPWNERGAWLTPTMRQEGRDFESGLPGGEIDGLYAFESAGEVLKLLVRVFTHVTHVAPRGMDPQPAGNQPDPSAFAFNRIGLDG